KLHFAAHLQLSFLFQPQNRGHFHDVRRSAQFCLWETQVMKLQLQNPSIPPYSRIPASLFSRYCISLNPAINTRHINVNTPTVGGITMRVPAKYSLLISAFLGIFALSSFAQVPTGTIRGIVTDPSKAIVPHATVTVRNRATGAERKGTSNSTGEYQVPALPPGEYEVKVSQAGFKTGVSIVTLQVGESVSLDFELAVGQASDTVIVTSDTPTINTTDFKIDGVVNRKQIENLPLNGRNFLQLALLEPGVSVEAVDNPGTSPNNFFRVSIAGASQAMTRISVDGVSRSGSNDFHGSAFFYFRDHNLSAYPSLKRDPRRLVDPSREDPFFARRQGGGSIGGPVKKDKLFFFFNIENNNHRGVVPVANNNVIFSQFDSAPSNPLHARQANLKFDYKYSEKHSGFLRFSTDNNDNYNTANG